MVGRAKNIAVPTLLINGINEVASGDAVKPFVEEIPNLKHITLDGTTHSPNVERTDDYMRILGEFLTTS